MNKAIFILVLILVSCKSNNQIVSFGDELDFLQKHTSVIVLKHKNAYVAVSPKLQGRVLTSSSKGLEGQSYGWFNHNLIQDGLKTKNNVLGGEDRLWFGPEYGKYSVFFEAGKAMIGENILVPKPIDSESFNLISQNESTVSLNKKLTLVNYQNYRFNIEINRKISLLTKADIQEILNIDISNKIDHVGFVSTNTMINKNDSAWSMDTGLLSLWSLGAFHPSKNLTVILPLSQKATSIPNYWTEVNNDRLIIKGDKVFYKGDAQYLHKIGIPASLAQPVLGSYDADRKILTIVKYTFNQDSLYVNSLWDNDAPPYEGDVVNVFNDGPTDDGAGPFYELETSSSAKELVPGDSILHEHFTFHFEGEPQLLDKISSKTLGISLQEINAVFD